jgi:hypothetical protein
VSLDFPNHSSLNLSQYSQHHNNPSTPTLFYPAYKTQENGPPSLPCSPSGCPSPSRAPVQLVQNLHVGTLRTRSCGKSENIPKHLRHAGIDSWKEYTSNIYNQQYPSFPSIVHFPFPSQDTNEERGGGGGMNQN